MIPTIANICPAVPVILCLPVQKHPHWWSPAPWETKSNASTVSLLDLRHSWRWGSPQSFRSEYSIHKINACSLGHLPGEVVSQWSLNFIPRNQLPLYSQTEDIALLQLMSWIIPVCSVSLQHSTCSLAGSEDLLGPPWLLQLPLLLHVETCAFFFLWAISHHKACAGLLVKSTDQEEEVENTPYFFPSTRPALCFVPL